MKVFQKDMERSAEELLGSAGTSLAFGVVRVALEQNDELLQPVNRLQELEEVGYGTSRHDDFYLQGFVFTCAQITVVGYESRMDKSTISQAC